jgi:two-component system LytT family response regulator/two-component system response regulator LytT
MPMRAVVVDDEQLARDELCFQLGQLGDVEVVGQAGNGPEAIDAIERLRPDVVFLDIQMPGLGGFDVARALIDRDLGTHIVFVTAYDQHAIEAFAVNAIDYVLKPIEPGRLEQSVQRARRRVDADAPLNEQLERIVRLVGGRQHHRGQIAVRVGDRFLLVQADDVIYASLNGDTISIVTNSLSGASNYRTLDEL